MPLPRVDTRVEDTCPAPEPPKKRECNRHSDCDAADAERAARTGESPPFYGSHCHDDCCEECFGN